MVYKRLCFIGTGVNSKMALSVYQRLFLLFVNFFKIALFVVGGGIAMLPVIEEVFVKKYKLLTHNQFLDMIVLTQTVPGLIAVNAAVYVGTKIAGLWGAVISLIGVALPSMAIIIFIAWLFPSLDTNNPYLISFFMGVKACVAGMFIVLAIRIARKTLTNWIDCLLVLSFFVLVMANVNPAIVILMSIPVGYFYILITQKRLKQVQTGKDVK